MNTVDKKRPQCLGFIMDGNRRWAKEQGMETYVGHERGGEVLRECVSWLVEEEIPHAVFYAFSTENWKRGEREVAYLVDLFRDWISKIDRSVRIRFVGRRNDFPGDLIESMNQVERDTTNNVGKTTVWIALSYGGRDEIIRAVNRAVEEAVEGGKVAKFSEENFATFLDTAELPDPDMIVRTSGEKRLSNFLTWRSVYSELYFIEKHWPALTRADFEDILVEYEKRNRRRGA